MVLLSTSMRRKLAIKMGGSLAHLSEWNAGEFRQTTLVRSLTGSTECGPLASDTNEARRALEEGELDGPIAFIELPEASEDVAGAVPSATNQTGNHGKRNLLRAGDEIAETIGGADIGGSEEQTEPVFWTPDTSHRYGSAHQATLESALSIVLAPSTLVGFRVAELSRQPPAQLNLRPSPKVSPSRFRDTL